MISNPEDTCASYCLLKGGTYPANEKKVGDHRTLASEKKADDCKLADEDRRLGASSSSSAAQCKAGDSSSSDHRLLGSSSSSSSSSFCPLDRTYYLQDKVASKCFNDSFITEAHLHPDAEHNETHCVFFDFNPDTHLCCIPAYDEPPVPSFNRYTVDYNKAKKKWATDDHRRLGGGGGAARRGWMKSLEWIEEDDVYNKCPAPVRASAHPHIFAIGATLNLFEFSCCLCILILATLFLEVVTDTAHDYVRSLHNHHYRAIYGKIVSELMILGCISFIIFISEVELGLASASYYLELELAHLMLFFIGLIFAVQSIYLLMAMEVVCAFWRSIDPSTDDKLGQLCEQAITGKPHRLSWWRKVILAESLRFHIVKQEFLLNRNLPSTFAFVNFIDKYFVKLIMHTVHIEWWYWLLVIFFVWVNQARSYILDAYILPAPYYTTNSQLSPGVAPYTKTTMQDNAGQTVSPNDDAKDFPDWGYWYFIGLGWTLLGYSILICYWCGAQSINKLVSEVLMLLSGENEAFAAMHACDKHGSYLGSSAKGASAEGGGGHARREAQASQTDAEAEERMAKLNTASHGTTANDEHKDIPVRLSGFLDFPAYNLCVKAMQRDSKMYEHLATILREGDQDEADATAAAGQVHATKCICSLAVVISNHTHCCCMSIVEPPTHQITPTHQRKSKLLATRPSTVLSAVTIRIKLLCAASYADLTPIFFSPRLAWKLDSEGCAREQQLGPVAQRTICRGEASACTHQAQQAPCGGSCGQAKGSTRSTEGIKEKERKCIRRKCIRRKCIRSRPREAERKQASAAGEEGVKVLCSRTVPCCRRFVPPLAYRQRDTFSTHPKSYDPNHTPLLHPSSNPLPPRDSHSIFHHAITTDFGTHAVHIAPALINEVKALSKLGKGENSAMKSLEVFRTAALRKVVSGERLDRMQAALCLLLLCNIFYLTAFFTFYVAIMPKYELGLSAIAIGISMGVTTPLACKNFFFLRAIAGDANDQEVLREVKVEEQDAIIAMSELASHVESRCRAEDITVREVFVQWGNCLSGNFKERMKHIQNTVSTIALAAASKGRKMDLSSVITAQELLVSLKRAELTIDKRRLRYIMDTFDGDG
jgi:hypothetical protein